MGDVIKPKFGKSPKDSIPWPVMCNMIATMINGGVPQFGDAAWHHVFRVIEPERGKRLVVSVDDGQVMTVVAIEDVINKLVSWARESCVPDWYMTPKKAKDAVETWRAVAVPVSDAEIRFLRWADEEGYTWHRLPWKRNMVGGIPTWDAMLARIGNCEAFVDWIGSLFYEDSDQQQYCYLHGKGADGKGAINRFMARVFGGAYCSKQPPTPGDKFWSYGLISKRLVVFPDCNSRTFVTSGFFKSMTGGDPVTLEAKGQMSFTAKLSCKFLFLSNEKPSLSSEDSDRRRIIYCEMQEREDKTPEPGFENKLWEEGGAFLALCLNWYDEKYKDRGQIKADMSVIDDHVDTIELKYSSVFDEHFCLSDDKASWVLPNDLWRLLDSAYKNKKDGEDFLKWLERTHKIRKKTSNYPGGKSDKRYKGMAFKNYIKHL